MIVTGILLIAVLVLSGFLYTIYANVIKSGNTLREAASGIDVQLKKRYDLIPNILTIAKRFMEHENEIFTEITKYRTMAMNAAPNSKAAVSANAQIDGLMSKLMVSVENYPTLKSDATMVQAMQTYNEVEEHIAAARRFYNSALTQLRNVTQIFPGTIFADLVREELKNEYYVTDETSRQSVNAKDYL